MHPFPEFRVRIIISPRETTGELLPGLESDLRPHRSQVYSWTALALLVFLFAVNVYRAATQSITIDEAFNYHKHIAGPRFWQFEIYTANNHVLHTLLAKLSITLFGLSELAFRLPSVLGGALYFAAVFRLAGLLFGSSIWFLLFVAVNSLNPGILDYLSAARGYGLGLALLMWAVIFLLQSLERPVPRTSDAVKIALMLGLGTAAQLTYAVPAAAMGLMFLAVVALRRAGFKPAFTFVGVAVAVPIAILAWPMRHAQPGDFYVGEASLWDSIVDLGRLSVFYRPTVLSSAGRFAEGLLQYSAGIMLAGALAATAFLLLRRKSNVQILAPLGLVAGSVALLYLARIFIARPFPPGRAAVYFFPLVSMVCLIPFRHIRTLKVVIPGVMLTLLCVVQFALEFQVSYYSVYKASAGVKGLFQALEAAHGASRHSVRLGCSWELADALEFYRVMRRTSWLAPITREGPDCHYDFYALLPTDSAVVPRFDLVELHRDGIAGAVLARPSEAALSRLAATYPPPLGTAPPCGVDPATVGAYVRMSESGAERYFARDIAVEPKLSPDRWTFVRPMLLFRPDHNRERRFRMRFQLTGHLFPPGSGPLTVTVWVNSQLLACKSFDAPGEHDFEADVPPAFFGKFPIAAVEMAPSRYIEAEDGVKLGLLVSEAGFVSPAPEPRPKPHPKKTVRSSRRSRPRRR